MNGSPFEYFSPSRGLRQGDLLSPFLLILVSEVLSHLLLREENIDNLKGVKLNAYASAITHLLFADGLLFFAKVSPHEAKTINGCLEKYKQWSGQLLNQEKLSIHFRKNTTPQVIAQVSDSLHLSSLPAKAKPLGLPLIIIIRVKSQALSEIQDHIFWKLHGWRAKLLSQA